MGESFSLHLKKNCAFEKRTNMVTSGPFLVSRAGDVG